MREFDRDGQMLCAIQGKIFERSLSQYETSSPVFARRFMNSSVAAAMDTDGFLERPFSEEEAYEAMDREYGKSSYGEVRYPPDMMYWIGYLYRYWAYVYQRSSKSIYRIIGARELAGLYDAYHSLDPGNAIERIMEAKGLREDSDVSLERSVELLRRIRRESYGRG